MSAAASESVGGDPIALASELVGLPDAERRDARVRRRADIAGLRLNARRVQGVIRLADALAKLSGGSLLTVTLLLIINGQVSWPVVATALLALLVFIASTILLMRLDHQVAAFDHAADLIDAALKEAER